MEETNYRVTEISQDDFETILGTYDFSITYIGKNEENMDAYASPNSELVALVSQSISYLFYTTSNNCFALVEKL